MKNGAGRRQSSPYPSIIRVVYPEMKLMSYLCLMWRLQYVQLYLCSSYRLRHFGVVLRHRSNVFNYLFDILFDLLVISNEVGCTSDALIDFKNRLHVDGIRM
jgi:hypothetical protein